LQGLRREQLRLRAQYEQLREVYADRLRDFDISKEEWEDDTARLIAAQHELEISRERYAQLYDYAPVGYATLDHVGSVRELNLTAAALLDYRREELVGRPLLTLLRTGERRRWLDYMVKLRTVPGSLTSEFEVQRRDKPGAILQFIGEASFDIHTPAGTIRLALLDITQQRHAEQALEESEGRFRTMADSAPVMIWVSGRDNACLYFNRPWLQFTGRTLEQELGRGWKGVVHPEDLAGFLEKFTRASEAQHEFRVEMRLRREDGQYRWMLHHGVPRFADTNQFAGFIGSCVDITERREAEEAIRQARDELASRVRERTAELSLANECLRAEIAKREKAELARAQLGAIVESSLDAIVGEDLDGRITSWNQAAERIFGYSAAEMAGRSFAQVLPAAGRKDYRRVRGRLMIGEVVESFEMTAVRKGGHRLQVSLTVSPILDARGNVAGTSTSARDVSRQRRLEAEIVNISEREQQRIARDLHEGLGQQLAGISCLSNILKGKLAGHDGEESVMAAKISGLLNATVAQSRDLAQGLQPVPPAPDGLMSVLAGLAARTASLFNVACRFECPRPVLLNDNVKATHLYRIAQEAVSNAIRHGRARELEIDLSSASAGITLAVRNDGLPFRQAAHAPKGMGLAIMKYRAGRLGGSLTVQPSGESGVQVICNVPAPGARRAASRREFLRSPQSTVQRRNRPWS
jgi:PAS domain S-box-containing protein